MASEKWNIFKESAKIPALKIVLNKLGLPISGNKSTLWLRIEEAVKDFDEQQILELIPDAEHNGNGDVTDDRVSDVSDYSHEEIIFEKERNDFENVGNNSLREENANFYDLNKQISELRKITEKKREILELKKELERLELKDKQVTLSGSMVHSFRDIEDAIPSFSGDDNFTVERWIDIFEENATVMEFDERSKFIYAKRLLKGTAKIFLRTVSVKSWSELKLKLKKEFKKHVSKSDIHNQLRKRKKRGNETFQQYILTMQEIACMGGIDEEDIIQYIIKGIPDSESNKTLLYSASTMDEFKNAIRKYERLKLNSYEAKPVVNKKENSTEKKSFTRGRILCFKCNEYGHYSRNCTNERKCTPLPQSMNNADVMNVGEPSSEPQEPPADDITASSSFEHVLRYVFLKDNCEFSTSLSTLLDSGSPISFVQEAFVPACVVDNNIHQHHRKFCGINGSPLCVKGTVTCKINYDNSIICLNVFVVDNKTMKNPIVLGKNFLEKNNIMLVKNKTRLSSKTKEKNSLHLVAHSTMHNSAE